jgi:hypothetical protein
MRSVNVICTLHQKLVVIKSRKIRWMRYVAGKGVMRNIYTFWSESLKGTDSLEDAGLDGKIILNQIIRCRV